MRKASRSRVLRVGWIALPVAMGSLAVVGACSDEDPVTPGRDGGPDTRKPPSELPPPSIDPNQTPDAAVDAKTLYPPAWERDADARDASLDAQDRFCNPTGGPGRFCWDFQFADDGLNWQEVIADGGRHELFLSGGPPARERALRSTVEEVTGPGPKWVALRYLLNNVDDAPAQSAGFTLSFSFHVKLLETYAVIGAVGMGTQVYGLAVYPKGCHGLPCLGELTKGPPPSPDFANRRPFDPDRWYRASVRLKPAVVDGKVTWGSTITVGGAVVATREKDAFPPIETFPSSINLFVGVFDTKEAGNTQVEIDDVILE